MSFKVTNTAAYLTAEAEAHLEQNGCKVEFVELDELTEDEFCAALRGVEAVIASGEWWTDKTLGAGAADRLKIVARSGAGVDHVNLVAATRHGVQVTNTPGATSFAVADFTMGLILCLLRGIPGVAHDMKRGVWQQSCGRELGQLTLGVVGTGSIGKEVIKRAAGFGGRILAFDIAEDDGLVQQHKVEYFSLDKLVAESDIVSLHCPLTEETKGLISVDLLNQMKPKALLVNTSRAPVVDRAALMEALQSGRIGAAAIDVHDPVPCCPDDPLVLLDNVLATPFMAYRTEECIARMSMTAAKDVVAVLQGHPPKHPVNQL